LGDRLAARMVNPAADLSALIDKAAMNMLRSKSSHG
jgi:hypothetical protein